MRSTPCRAPCLDQSRRSLPALPLLLLLLLATNAVVVEAAPTYLARRGIFGGGPFDGDVGDSFAHQPFGSSLSSLIGDRTAFAHVSPPPALTTTTLHVGGGGGLLRPDDLGAPRLAIGLHNPFGSPFFGHAGADAAMASALGGPAAAAALQQAAGAHGELPGGGGGGGGPLSSSFSTSSSSSSSSSSLVGPGGVTRHATSTTSTMSCVNGRCHRSVKTQST